MRDFFIPCVIMALMSFCGEITEYTISNYSDCNLVIKGYDRFSEQTAETIILGIGESYIVERETGETWDPRGFFSISGVDSVRLEFNGEKVLLSVCDVDPMDCPFCDECYYNLVRENGSGFKVVVTKEDCLNAEPM